MHWRLSLSDLGALTCHNEVLDLGEGPMGNAGFS